MLAIGLKNSILVILILLILHFLLKNFLLEKSKTQPITSANANSVKEGFKNTECDKEELIKYVAMEDDISLDKYFKPSDKVESTTCTADVKPAEEENKDKKIKADCNLNQDKKNVMLLTEYEDEKDMNGGLLPGGLSGFDTFDLNYESYSDSCAR